MGVLFIALAVACLVLATLILVRGAQLEWVLGGAICLAAIVAFMLSRTVGLPQMGDDIGNWTEPWSFPALAAEALMALLAAEHLGSRRSRLNRHPEQAVLPAPGSLSPRPPE